MKVVGVKLQPTSCTHQVQHAAYQHVSQHEPPTPLQIHAHQLNCHRHTFTWDDLPTISNYCNFSWCCQTRRLCRPQVSTHSRTPHFLNTTLYLTIDVCAEFHTQYVVVLDYSPVSVVRIEAQWSLTCRCSSRASRMALCAIVAPTLLARAPPPSETST